MFGSRRIALPVTGVAAAAAAVAVGLTPTMSTAPALTAATVDYLRGTNIGWTPTDQEYRDFIGRVLTGTDTPADPPTSSGFVDYNAGFWPFSNNGIFDLTWNKSVAQGLHNLEAKDPSGDVVFGMSQGAVVLSRYKAAHPEGTGNTFVLVENPSRPNGGILERFAGLYIPILDISLSGATPDNGDTTVDVARQYDGWADFPTYPLNLLATVNAIMGMIYVHGQTQTELTPAAIEAAEVRGGMYYQVHGDTKYYLVMTPLLPLLMPLEGVLPYQVLQAIDGPLRVLVEMGYDRTDYSVPTKAQLLPGIPLLPSFKLPKISLPAATVAQKTAAPAAVESTTEESTATATAPKARSAKKALGAKKASPAKSSVSPSGGAKKSTGGSARPSKKSAD